MSSEQPRSSRQRYRGFVDDYKARRLDDATEARDAQRRLDDSAKAADVATATGLGGLRSGKRREYLREYLRWLRPHRYAVGWVFVLALVAAGLEMLMPLFTRFIIDRILLNAGLDLSTRLARLQLAGATFLLVVLISNLIGALKDYRQRLLNVRVMLSLRRSLFDRLL